MSHERGSYRAITRVLLDGQDFQKFTPAARLVFIALKVDFGPAGIEVHYAESLLWQLAHQTGYTNEQCAVAMSELADAGWIQREENVVWIVKQLKYEPSLTVKNRKHRTMIRNHIDGLPTLAIVKGFVMAYRDWFDDADEVLIRYRKATDTVSKHRDRDRDRRQKQKTDIPPADADGVPAAESWTARLAAVWSSCVGDVRPGRIGAALKPAVDRHGAERVERAMRAYVAVQKADGKPCKLAWFAEQSQVWIERTTSPLGVVDGEWTDSLELASRPSRGAA